MSGFPADWPGLGPIDLAVHDRPHGSSTTEWWYVNTHLTTNAGRALSLFASFFRIVKGRNEQTKELEYAHSLTWAITDVATGQYWAESRVDKCAPQIGLQKMDRGEGARDPRLRRAIREVLEQGRVPHPDILFRGDVYVAQDNLELDFDGCTFRKLGDGSYALHLKHDRLSLGCDLTFVPRKAPVRHGDGGVVRGSGGEDMFYYFIPRCDVSGEVLLAAGPEKVVAGQGWYDHEFGLHAGKTEDNKKGQDIGWNWLGVQLDDGRELSGYGLFDDETGERMGQLAVLIAEDGSSQRWDDLYFEGTQVWSSARTFHDYPTHWHLRVPSAQIDLQLAAVVDDQEFVTLISKPAFWEGRIAVAGTIEGQPVSGLGYLERSGQGTIENLDQFFSAVGRLTRKSVNALIPHDPSWAQVRDLVASPDRPGWMDGVDVPQFSRTMIKPVREIVDRGGKSWRSYAALACCDVVGGDSRKFVQWLAMPELMHVGSLIVDDVQDKSQVRRGGPATHLIYGESIAINAGTACYFMGQRLLQSSEISDRAKLRLYDFYFESLRAGHAGQALDLDGLDAEMPRAVEEGGGDWLVSRVLAVHRLKTAAPAAALARMGALAGGGSDAQVEGVGQFFESVGLAFQIIDDVLNLRGFKGDLKAKGEDVSHGKVTLPVAKAMQRLERDKRAWLWDKVSARTDDQAVVQQVIALLEECGAVQDCEDEARALVEDAWQKLDPLVEASMPKVMLRAFGWYVLERHY